MSHKKPLPEVLQGMHLPEKLKQELLQIVEYGGIDLPDHLLFWPNRLISTFITTLGTAYGAGNVGPQDLPTGIALAALFDLVVNTEYARQAVDQGWIYCLGSAGELPPAQYYPFIGACPRCTVSGFYRAANARKPTSSNIGDAAGLSMILILRQALSLVTSDYHVVGSARRQGDVDVFIYGPDFLTLAEIKASPLVSYPLEVILDAPLSAMDSGQHVPFPNHHKESPRILREARTIYLYLPHRDLHIDLGPKDKDAWPYPALINWLAYPENLILLVEAWAELFNLYVRRERKMPAFYLTHGCGSRISDSKNMPGLDRTDDIKKGTYQVLKYGAYYGADSPRRIVKAALLGNIHTVVHFEEYLSKLEDVVWTKQGMLTSLTEDEYSVRKSDIFPLYDGIICFTRNESRDTILMELFNWEELARRIAAGL